MREAMFYNALATLTEGNYSALKKLKDSSSTWEGAWSLAIESKKYSSIIIPDPESLWQKLVSQKIELLTRSNPNYPKILHDIPRPPLGIYIRGNKAALRGSSLAIVGTRKATEEGLREALYFGEKLGAAGLHIISGLALGIDAAAHIGALQSETPAIAVLANGLNQIYPRTNQKLGEKIIDEGGVLVSEYPPGIPVLPYRLLERNRIVSGLSSGTLVIEAPEKSGSLKTAEFAIGAGRRVFVIPGPIHHPNFKGSHALIRSGAELITSPEDILKAFHIEKPAPFVLEPEEKTILEILEKSKMASTDTIIERTGLDPERTNECLTKLLLENKIRETMYGYTVL